LQGSLRLIRTDPDALAARIEQAVDDLDLTAKHIRTAIFGLETSRPDAVGLRAEVLAIVRKASDTLGFEPRVLLDGPLDTGVPDTIGRELLTTLREALSNVTKHARASRVEVAVTVSAGVSLQVTDNGIGPPDADAVMGNGLRNMSARAERLGGSMTLRPASSSGSVLEWRVPLR
jgi:signal transduction histidine kinase